MTVVKRKSIFKYYTQLYKNPAKRLTFHYFSPLQSYDDDDPPTPPWQDRSHRAPSVTEMSKLIIFLLDVLPLVKNPNTYKL